MEETFLAGNIQDRIQMANKDIIMKVENLTKYYISGYVLTKKILGAENVSFDLKKGEVLSIVGESGSGKSTVANMILRLFKPTSGKILLDSKDAFSYNKIDYWRRVQAIFQDPYSTFNNYYAVDKPLMDSFGLIENSGKKYSKTERIEIINKTLETIGMNPDEILGRYPHQTSGGEMQRLLIARALIIGPEVLVADEPTSMTDASTRVAILNELLRLKETRDMAVLFVTHDVGQAYYVSDRAAVMKDGRIVEMGPAEDVFFNPEHPYTKNLIASVPKVHEKWEI
jgi:peptide/nickel transport system ATP-binding protein